jgi:hypothetical protein
MRMHREHGWFSIIVALTGCLVAAACSDTTSPEHRPTTSLVGGLLTSDLTVRATTRGADLDPDGYTVTLDGTDSEHVATNGSVSFAVGPGFHRVALSGAVGNCTVSGDNPRTILTVAAVDTATTFTIGCEALPPPPPPSGTRVTGLGALGPGAATPGSDRLEFDFDATDAPDGRLWAIDYSVVRGDGSAGNITVDSESDPETGVTSFDRTSTACVRFGGVGRLDTGELYEFYVDACDNADPGPGADTFAITLPDRFYTKSGTLTEGDIAIGTY